MIKYTFHEIKRNKCKRIKIRRVIWQIKWKPYSMLYYIYFFLLLPSLFFPLDGIKMLKCSSSFFPIVIPLKVPAVIYWYGLQILYCPALIGLNKFTLHTFTLYWLKNINPWSSRGRAICLLLKHPTSKPHIRHNLCIP